MRGLILSGGGCKGAFQVGVLKEWIINQGRNYDYIAGVSVGALNVAMLGQSKPENLIQGFSKLEKIWANIRKDSDVWKHWLIPYIPGLMFRDSFYNSSPLMNMIKNNLDVDIIKKSGRTVKVGVVGLAGGEYVEIDQNFDGFSAWVTASSAFPAFLTPVPIADDLWADGGIRSITPIKGAIDAGVDTIDVIVTSPLRFEKKDFRDNWAGSKVDAIDVAKRSIDIMTTEIFLRDLKICELYNHLAKAGETEKKHIKVQVASPKIFLTKNSLEFNQKKILEMKKHGQEIAPPLEE